MGVMNQLHRWLCRSDWWRRALTRQLLPWAVADLDLGDALLEVGPGPGLGTDALRRRAAQLTVIEIDPRLADSLRARMAGTNVTVVEGDATAMPFPDASFSGAVCCTMLHHVPSAELQDRLLSELRRVLRPGAWLAGSDSLWSPSFGLLHVFDTCVPVDPAGFRARLEGAGFREVEVVQARSSFRFQARCSL